MRGYGSLISVTNPFSDLNWSSVSERISQQVATLEAT